MKAIDDILSVEPYSLEREEKRAFLVALLNELSEHHYGLCPEYLRILDAIGAQPGAPVALEEISFLPVRLFKELDLRSVEAREVFKTMTSSGTSGALSRIFLDRETAKRQTKTLAKIVSSTIGKRRLPMIILDSSAVLKDRTRFSARGAGIVGFSMFGRDRIYALDEGMNLDIAALDAFLEKYAGETIFLFGFTYIIWRHFCQRLVKEGRNLDLSRGVLIHGGGWKKLLNEAISTERFKQGLQKACGLTRIYNYYGLVEQTGTISMECEHGHLHVSAFSDLIVRRPHDFSPAKVGEKGLIQTLSVVPTSYPGHSLLTEDEGRIVGEDDCPCGRKGKYFEVLGRLKMAEVRGCSDTYKAPNH